MVIRITFKRLVLILLTFIVGLNVYLCETNYWFDRKLFSQADPFLKEIMNVEYYRVDKSTECSLNGARFNDEIAKLFLNFKKHNVITTISINECPSQVIRMTNDDSVNEVFHQQRNMKCKTDEAYFLLKKLFYLTQELLKDQNFKFYSFHAQSDCVNSHIVQENIKKYSNQIFSTKVNTLDNLPNGRHWILKHGKYYYLASSTNALQGHIQDLKREHYLIFKKLTLEQLMRYDNGSYWKLIKDYNIKID